VPTALVEAARWSPLAGLYDLAELELVEGGGRALVGALLVVTLALGARPSEAGA
jgi:hypothetical protein